MKFARMFALGLFATSIPLAVSAQGEITFSKSGGTLKINGDAQNDTINVLGTAVSGAVMLFDAVQQIGAVDAVHDIVVNTGAGDDLVLVIGVQIGGSIKIKTGTGVDHVAIRGDGGQVERELLVAGNIDVSMGRQAGDEFELDTDTKCGASIGRNVVIRGATKVEFTGSFGSANSEARDVRIGGDLRIDTAGDGPTTLSITGTNIHGAMKLGGSQQADSITLEQVHCLRVASIRTLGGDDSIKFGTNSDVNRFGSTIVVDGGPGLDTAKSMVKSTFAVTPVVKNVETQI